LTKKGLGNVLGDFFHKLIWSPWMQQHLGSDGLKLFFSLRTVKHFHFFLAPDFPKLFLLPWRRGAVDIASASGTRRPGFESRQGIRLFRKT
jgi:hypothetical protein